MSEKVWDANRIAKLVALETTVENIRARWPLESGPALAALVSVLDIFDPEVKEVGAQNLGDLQAELDHLAEVRKDRHERAWEIDRINMIFSRLEYSQEFDAAEKEVIRTALAVHQNEMDTQKEEYDQVVHSAVIAVANRIYYAGNETERGEILQAYAEWYHAQCVMDQNLEHVNRIARSQRIAEQEAPDVDDVPF